MVGYEYDGIATVKNAIELPYVSNRYGAKANVSKGMGFWESTFKLTGNYSLYKSKQLINSLRLITSRNIGVQILYILLHGSLDGNGSWFGIRREQEFYGNKQEHSGSCKAMHRSIGSKFLSD